VVLVVQVVLVAQKIQDINKGKKDRDREKVIVTDMIRDTTENIIVENNLDMKIDRTIDMKIDRTI
jgi:hypothetical protein